MRKGADVPCWKRMRHETEKTGWHRLERNTTKRTEVEKHNAERKVQITDNNAPISLLDIYAAGIA